MDGVGRARARGVIRVVLADDDEAFLRSLQALLDKQSGLAVAAAATDSLQAIALVDELEPDALIIDLHMPQLDGVSAIARLRRNHPSLCLIALTGDESRELHEAVEQAGGDAVLLKSELVENLAERLVAVIPLLERGSG